MSTERLKERLVVAGVPQEVSRVDLRDHCSVQEVSRKSCGRVKMSGNVDGCNMISSETSSAWLAYPCKRHSLSICGRKHPCSVHPPFFASSNSILCNEVSWQFKIHNHWHIATLAPPCHLAPVHRRSECLPASHPSIGHTAAG